MTEGQTDGTETITLQVKVGGNNVIFVYLHTYYYTHQ